MTFDIILAWEGDNFLLFVSKVILGTIFLLNVFCHSLH